MKQPVFHFENFFWEVDNPFGDDMVTFKFNLVVEDDGQKEKIPAWLRLSDILYFMQEQEPELHKYIQDTRYGIKGWGPKETKLMNEF